MIAFNKVQPTSSGTVTTASDTLTITTDCSAGSNVYISAVNGSSSGTSLVNNAANSNNEISALSGTTIGTTALALQNNTWGFNTVNSDTYYGLPNFVNATDHAIYSGTNTNVPIYYGAKVTSSLAPGKYNGQVLYTATVSNSCLNYTIVFDKNANDATGTMDNQIMAPATSTMLTASAFTRPNYVFAGWSTDPNATTPTYTNKQSVTDLASAGNSITLYAVWGVTMQNWAADFGCDTLNTNDYLTLYDSRDGNPYVVKKLADNKCWMVQNLRLTNYNLTSADSDVSSDFNMTLSETTQSGNTSGWCESATSNCVDQISAYYNSSNPGNSALYNWYTATAGSGTSSMASNSAISSICPKGWRLPIIRSNLYEFGDLYSALGSNYATMTGDYAVNGNANFGTGTWWSSSATSDIYTSRLTILSSGEVYPGNPYYKYAAYYVRCIAMNTSGNMQNFDPSTLSTNNYITLTDRRDGNNYVVKKLIDGSVWMVQNLRLTDYNLSSADSDVSSFNMTASNTVQTDPSGWCANANESCDHKISVYYDSSTRSSYGALYNWYTATAGSGNYSMNSGYASSSICPKGWRLMTIADSAGLWSKFGSNISTMTGDYAIGNNANFDRTGRIYNSSLGDVNRIGHWWLSNAYYNNNYAYESYYSTSGSNPNNGTLKSSGDAVRCISAPDCSDTIHPTATDGCKMKDGNTWIVGNNGNGIAWSTMCTSSDNCDSATYCPSGYSIPTHAVQTALVNAQGDGDELSKVLNISNINFWSSTESGTNTAYMLYIRPTYAGTAYPDSGKNDTYGLMCYKTP